MIILPVPTPLLRPGDDLVAILKEAINLQPGDILALSSKAVATCEDAFYQLHELTVSPEAADWAEKCRRSEAFCQAVLIETDRLRGRVLGHCPGALFTDVRPDGMSQGTIITANAGLDESNTPPGTAIGWPRDPVMSVKRLQQELSRELPPPRSLRSHPSPVAGEGLGVGAQIAVLLTDSRVSPRRIGVTAFTLACAGIDPLKQEIGNTDLFGRPLTITVEAVADQLATMANFLMGNAGQSCPAAVIRDHGLKPSDFCGWVPGIEPEVDLFNGLS